MILRKAWRGKGEEKEKREIKAGEKYGGMKRRGYFPPTSLFFTYLLHEKLADLNS
jgi:hypothetical protein